MKLTIGDVTLENNVILAPMAGVTDLPFRLLCKEQGAGLLCMEMISAKALRYKNKNTKALLAIDPREYPVSLQLFGEDPDIISEQAKRIEELPFQILDINMGCPVPKVVRNGEGSALMKDPKRIYDIVYKTARAIKKPVTIKIRKGFDDTCINAPEIAKVAEEAGAAAIAVHGRTREQYYSGNADWEIIRKVKEAVKIAPVYYVTGNHEYWLDPSENEQMMQGILAAGAYDLDDEAVCIEKGDSSFMLIGLDDQHLSDETLKNLLQEQKNELSIVLAHEPQYLQNYANAGADLVLTGHAHGGQIRLPFVGGIVAPDQGFLPEYTSGKYNRADTEMIVSRGLGNSIIPVRLFNYPEVVCVELRCKN